MLEELADHIMDIAMNSVRAGARNVAISILSDLAGEWLSVRVTDDGMGMAEETVKKAVDPFYSTKEGKAVGLGIPLLKGAAELCGGDFHLHSTPGEGTEIEALFPLHHPDMLPLGNLKETIFLLCVTNPEVRFSFRSNLDGRDSSLDTKEINEILCGVPINHPEVVGFLSRYIGECL
jgi:hypothetical protein